MATLLGILLFGLVGPLPRSNWLIEPDPNQDVVDLPADGEALSQLRYTHCFEICFNIYNHKRGATLELTQHLSARSWEYAPSYTVTLGKDSY